MAQHSQPNPQSGGVGQACVWFVSCLLFLLLLTGGVFLALYIFLPSSPDLAWLLPAGMGLVAAPWIFWILTCLYRCIVLRIVYAIGRAEDRSPPPPPQVTRHATAVATAAPLATVIEEEPESPGGAAVTGGKNGDEETGVGPQKGGSSSTSRESERPLAHSMNS